MPGLQQQLLRERIALVRDAAQAQPAREQRVQRFGYARIQPAAHEQIVGVAGEEGGERGFVSRLAGRVPSSSRRRRRWQSRVRSASSRPSPIQRACALRRAAGSRSTSSATSTPRSNVGRGVDQRAVEIDGNQLHVARAHDAGVALANSCPNGERSAPAALTVTPRAASRAVDCGRRHHHRHRHRRLRRGGVPPSLRCCEAAIAAMLVIGVALAAVAGAYSAAARRCAAGRARNSCGVSVGSA